MSGLLTVARFTLAEALGRRAVLYALAVGLLFLCVFALGSAILHARAIEAAAARPTSDRLLLLFAGGSAHTVFGLYAIHLLASGLAIFLASGASRPRSSRACCLRSWPGPYGAASTCSGAGWG